MATNATATKEAARAAHRMVDELSNRVEPVEIRAREGAGAAAETASQHAEALKDSAKSAVNRFEETVRERPLTAAGVAFAVGYLASALLRRGS